MDSREADTPTVAKRSQQGLSITIANGRARVDYENLAADYFDVICKGAVVADGKIAAPTKERRSWLRNNFDWVKAQIRPLTNQ